MSFKGGRKTVYDINTGPGPEKMVRWRRDILSSESKVVTDDDDDEYLSNLIAILQALI